MPFLTKKNALIVATFCIGTIMDVTAAHAVMDPRFEIDPKILTGTGKTATPRKTAEKRISRTQSKRRLSKSGKRNVYIAKQGENLLKTLMRDYDLSSSEAEAFIEDIKRENNIYDINRLKVGQKITIPPRALSHVSDSGIVPEHSFKLESPVSLFSEQEIVAKAQNSWNRIVPLNKELQKPLSIQTSAFSLKLDPERYPTFARMDGGRIILDQNGTIPQLVKSLIEDKDSSVKIVTETPSGAKNFISSLLDAGGFYSVEENYSMEFGVDPKLTIQADFKVEKTAESFVKQDVVLVNSRRSSLPPFLVEFLKKEGFSLHEPFASVKPFARSNSRTIHYVSAKKQAEVVDSILSAFSVSSERDRPVDVFAADNNGISLSVKAERFFERGGHRYVVTSFDGDPISYTLFRILETKGYKVVMLEGKDDFRKISEKMISSMDIKGTYAQHSLLEDDAAGYALQMSGFKLDDAFLPGGGIFLTDRTMDRIIKELVTENGFNINTL